MTKVFQMFNAAKLRITHKGMIIIAIPLMCELFFLGILWHLLDQSERETQQANHSKAIVASSDGLIKLYYDAGTALVYYGFTQKKSSEAVYEDIVSRIPQQFEELHGLVKDSPQQQETLERIQRIGDKGIGMLTEVYDELRVGHRSPLKFLGIQDKQKELQHSLVDLSNSLKELMEPEVIKQHETEEQNLRTRADIKKFMMLGIALSIGMAIMVALNLTRDIVFRIAMVADNTKRLAAGKPLTPPIPGDDEISYLDKTFREYIEKQKEVEQLKADFLSMVSHDLRTPICSIGNLLELFSAELYGEVNEKGQQRLSIAQREVDRLLQLINNLLDIEKMEAGKMMLEAHSTPLATVCERAIASVHAFAEKQKIQFQFEDNDGLCAQADEDRIVQVLVNLLSNATKFSPQASTITIRCTSPAEDKSFVKVEVIDEGRGIPEDLQAKIFERYEQVKTEDGKSKKGTGLGLAICKAIIEGHGGAIGATSAGQGKGSTFWFTLPSSAGFAESDTRSSTPLHSQASTSASA